MLCDSVLGLLVGREDKPGLFGLYDAATCNNLALFLVIGWCTLCELFIDEAIEESEVEVEVLKGDLGLSERDAENQVFSVVDHLG